MHRIIELLQEKNNYLEKFYSLNEDELLNFNEGNFDNLDHFYQTREGILRTVNYIDVEIEKCEIHPALEFSMETREAVREALAVKDEYVSRILAQDLEVISCIERAKSAIIRELQDVRKNRKAVSGYKSSRPAPRLNEEA